MRLNELNRGESLTAVDSKQRRPGIYSQAYLFLSSWTASFIHGFKVLWIMPTMKTLYLHANLLVSVIMDSPIHPWIQSFVDHANDDTKDNYFTLYSSMAGRSHPPELDHIHYHMPQGSSDVEIKLLSIEDQALSSVSIQSLEEVRP